MQNRKKKNPIAKVLLGSSLFRTRKTKNKKVYTRKTKHRKNFANEY